MKNFMVLGLLLVAFTSFAWENDGSAWSSSVPLNCDVRIRNSFPRMNNCSFDEVVTGVQAVYNNQIEVKCGRIEVQCR